MGVDGFVAVIWKVHSVSPDLLKYDRKGTLKFRFNGRLHHLSGTMLDTVVFALFSFPLIKENFQLYGMPDEETPVSSSRYNRYSTTTTHHPQGLFRRSNKWHVGPWIYPFIFRC